MTPLRPPRGADASPGWVGGIWAERLNMRVIVVKAWHVHTDTHTWVQLPTRTRTHTQAKGALTGSRKQRPLQFTPRGACSI